MKVNNKKSLKKYKGLSKQVSEILYNDWDPIGGKCPRDEYDSYVPVIVGMLLKNNSEEEIMKHLSRVEKESMGFKTKVELLRPVAAKLKKINISKRQ